MLFIYLDAFECYGNNNNNNNHIDLFSHPDKNVLYAKMVHIGKRFLTRDT